MLNRHLSTGIAKRDVVAISIPDRWSDVSRIFYAALGLPASARADYIRSACGGDDALRSEVESLLTHLPEADTFLDVSPAALPAKGHAAEAVSLVGRELGSYRIDAHIGSGGMGDVYTATDLRLGRRVALKLLSPHVRGDAERRASFVGEARAIAALHHPHICVLHDIGSDSGLDFLVMEYLDGETLAARLARGPLPRDEVYRYATEIADALSETHARGVVHRDLKPANIMITAAGTKLLDFGLATLQSGTSSDPGWAGTLPYMAPEQIEGGEIDARADIFAFGAILYEMATGRLAFNGTCRDDLTAPGVEPTRLRAVVRRCLSRHPDFRFQTADEIKKEIHQLERRSRKVRTSIAVTTGLLIGMVAVGSSAWVRSFVTGRSATASTFRNARLVVEADALPPSIDSDTAISQDGRLLAYVAATDTGIALFARSMTDGRTTQIVEANRSAIVQPRWSPDGQSLLYVVPSGVFVVPTSGGTPRRVDGSLNSNWMFLTQLVAPALAGGAAWSPDGRRIAIAAGGTLALVPAEGGTPQYLVRDYPHELHSCDWAPDNRWIACIASEFLFAKMPLHTDRTGALVLISTSGGNVRQLTPQVPEIRTPAWSRDGAGLYFISVSSNDSDIYRMGIDAEGNRVGVAERLTTGLKARTLTVSRTQIVYSVQTVAANIWSVGITSQPAHVANARRLTAQDEWVDSVTVSAGGKSLLYTTLTGQTGVFEVRVSGERSEPRARRSAEMVVPFGPPPDMSLASMFTRFRTASPDQRRVAYVQPGRDLAAPEVLVTERAETNHWSTPLPVPNGGWPVSWSPNSDFIAYPKYNGIDLFWPASGMQRRVYEPTVGNPRATAVTVSSTGSLLVLKSGDNSTGKVSFWALPISGGMPRLLLRGAPELGSELEPLLTWGGQDPVVLRNSGAGEAVDFAIIGDQLYFTQPERRSRAWIAPLPQ